MLLAFYCGRNSSHFATRDHKELKETAMGSLRSRWLFFLVLPFSFFPRRSPAPPRAIPQNLRRPSLRPVPRKPR